MCQFTRFQINQSSVRLRRDLMIDRICIRGLIFNFDHPPLKSFSTANPTSSSPIKLVRRVESEMALRLPEKWRWYGQNGAALSATICIDASRPIAAEQLGFR